VAAARHLNGVFFESFFGPIAAVRPHEYNPAMGDPFRTAPEPPACPACGAALREFHGRLCCDACGGVLMDTADLTASITDYLQQQIAAPPEVRFVDVKAAKRTCPLCKTPMTSCHLAADFEHKHAKTHPTLDRCANHGVWFDANELAEVLEALHHAAELPAHASLRQIIQTLVETWGHTITYRSKWRPLD
jgi:Zn-finger nucleic acid-binding protein